MLNDERFEAQIFVQDMPRTFASGSCIAVGGHLLLRRPEMFWYCLDDMGIELLPKR